MFADPIKNLKSFGLKEDMVVADLGAGTGFYSISAAALVPKGKVYAVEIQKDFIEKIKSKIMESRVGNIETIWGNIEKLGGTKIKDGVVNAVIASNILFQLDDKEKFIEETKRILTSGGQVLLIDWSSSLGHVEKIIPKNQAREMFERKGFTSVRDIDAGVSHYGMILRKT
ncbi:class I SAM-dependent methyltransferase [Patescibacteria group bacterium]|nr:class I SAM-dependent methyltransferase [Patescibacteria group bacterium]